MSATRGGVSIISFTTVIGFSVGIASACFPLIFSLTAGIIEKLLSITRNEKKKTKCVLVKSKLNYIKTLVSQALIDMEIRHEEFFTILNEKDKYEKMKEDIRTMKSSDECISENSVNSRS